MGLNYAEEVLIDGLCHNIDGCRELDSQEDGIQLTVSVVKREKANPFLFDV